MIYQNLVVDIFCPKSFFIILNRVTFIHLRMSELSIVTDSDLFIGSSPLQYPSTPDNTSTITNHGSSADFEEIQKEKWIHGECDFNAYNNCVNTYIQDPAYSFVNLMLQIWGTEICVNRDLLAFKIFLMNFK